MSLIQKQLDGDHSQTRDQEALTCSEPCVDMPWAQCANGMRIASPVACVCGALLGHETLARLKFVRGHSTFKTRHRAPRVATLTHLPHETVVARTMGDSTMFSVTCRHVGLVRQEIQSRELIHQAVKSSAAH